MPEIVLMQPCHLDAVAALERQCFSHPWSREALLEELQNPLAVMLTALEEERVAGYIGMYAVLDEGFVYNVAVDGAMRRRGIASALIAALLARGAVKKLHTITLEVRSSNQAAQALYARHGFAVVGVRKGYYSDPKEDGVLMTYTYPAGPATQPEH